eukprot:gnl/TRDRNA2_/TRDRNA2_177431_c1_seq1.p1 gnl/TRDRNA2_/TRDRNA2_177431_c1~~gnl/TRDRNA2_/TRDRNA2_177431_c1_seq1.p1  ORF type:complete len:392 (-),score=-1.51 gnl/TRDRNA2_/TRDRNA2_177431_c1_seq1:254-1429(-)
MRDRTRSISINRHSMYSKKRPSNSRSPLRKNLHSPPSSSCGKTSKKCEEKIYPGILKQNTQNRINYCTELRARKNHPANLNPIEKAATHAAHYLAMDPIEKLRRQVEQTVEAKLSLLMTKLENARDPKNKTQRKIYVGNLTSNVNGEFLKKLFTQTLLISYPQWNVPGQECVVEVQYRGGNKYCFIEFRTIEMAVAALQVNGVTVLDTQLHVSRPTGFLDPNDCEKAAKDAEDELNEFRSGKNDEPLLRQPGYSDLITKIRDQQIMARQISLHENCIESKDSSPYACLKNLVTASSMESDKELRALYDNVKGKIQEYGKALQMIIPVPPIGVKISEVFGRGHYGKILLEFADADSLNRVKLGLDGRTFEGRKITFETISHYAFVKAVGTIC